MAEQSGIPELSATTLATDKTQTSAPNVPLLIGVALIAALLAGGVYFFLRHNVKVYAIGDKGRVFVAKIRISTKNPTIDLTPLIGRTEDKCFGLEIDRLAAKSLNGRTVEVIFGPARLEHKIAYEGNPALYREDTQARAKWIAYYQSFTTSVIKTMTHDDFSEYIGKLWSMLIWGNKKYIVDKIITDNGLDNLKTHLSELLFGTKNIVARWDYFLKSIKGIGPATVSELLAYLNPNEYVIFNKTTVSCFNYLEISDMPVYNYQYTGKRFASVCKMAKEIAHLMKTQGIDDVSLLAVDYFLWDEVLPLIKTGDENTTPVVSDPIKATSPTAQSLHDEIIDMIVEIGRLLGFESNSEVKVWAGAKVDAIWEAKIGNMGKAIYVFEVQSKGSIDSLILNLMKAKNNAAVQAVVAVSDADQIDKIKAESTGTILESNLRTWDYVEVIEVYNALVKAHESINKLALVPDSFI